MFKIGEDLGIGVMDMPYRKSMALYCVRGSVCYPLAYFRSDALAQEAEELLELLAKGLLVRETPE